VGGGVEKNGSRVMPLMVFACRLACGDLLKAINKDFR